ncbi:hypothetical protein SAMN02745121_05973 [Nannocystis exedens]|uniref:Uncharacterized protein n=1 Tax=Nannocystis exedens TaxID=54 RepID=A0A1I2EAY7_9BACT|nr:hypothetical protein [Nannocystis exedens]PCC74848.1 hypothetical protein NAEX_07948 [Nannocystis exedens]SFE89837.1 hypothetical protein SAMN02745121_05973 [Nannocystis exedens]
MPSALLAAVLAFQVPQPPSAGAIEWQAPAGCPDRRALADAIVGRLGREPTADELSLVGRVQREGPSQYHLNLRLTVDGHAETRSLSARRCAALVDAAALLTALALDRAAAERSAAAGPVAPEAEPTPVEPQPPAPEPASEPGLAPATPAAPAADAVFDPDAPLPAPLPEPPPEPAAVTLPGPLAPAPPPRKRGPGALLRLSAGLEVGAVPAPTAGLELAAGVLWRRARLEFHAVHLVPQTEARPPNEVRVYLLGGGARGCARLFRGRFEFPLCGGAELGGLRGEGRGPGARAATGLWAAVFASAGATWRFHRLLGLSLAAQGLVRLASPSFDLQDEPEPVNLFASAPASLRLLLGLELRLGDPR